jgi:prepilin signal peptidase PulO-like enzyme (type II secretory pathway)
MMNAIYAFVALLLGLGTGFLINIVATRLAADKPLLGRLHCTHAKHPLTVMQAFPVVGYVLQRGKCSTCTKRLSVAYPVTEGITALLFLLLFALEGLGVSFFFHAAYTATLMLVLVMDWKHRDIYISVIGLGWLFALAGSFLLPNVGLASALIGAAVAGGFFLVAYVAARIMFRQVEEPLGSQYCRRTGGRPADSRSGSRRSAGHAPQQHGRLHALWCITVRRGHHLPLEPGPARRGAAPTRAGYSVVSLVLGSA